MHVLIKLFSILLSIQQFQLQPVHHVHSFQTKKTQDLMPTVTIQSTNKDTVFLNNYCSYYFKYLTHNYGYNAKGSCTYVALGSLLSFWDTNWDSRMIPSAYKIPTLMDDTNFNEKLESPGILHETNTKNLRKMTTQQYYSYIEKYSSVFFQFELIKLGKEQFGQYVFDTEDSPCALTFEQLQELLNYYLYQYRGFTKQDFSIETNTTDPLQFTISNVKKGIPVEIRVAKKTNGIITGGHAMIAYDYDESNNELYVHSGWDDRPTYLPFSSLGYNVFWDATAIIPKGKHICSTSFVYSNNYDRETFCPCELSMHPMHNHNHAFIYKYKYIDGDNKKHKAFCKCGKWNLEPHSFTHMFKSGNELLGDCNKCGATVVYMTF